MANNVADIWMRRIFESYEDDDSVIDTYFKDSGLIIQLLQNGCLDYIKNEVDVLLKSTITSGKLSIKWSEHFSFTRGSVYGYVFSKTSDRSLALKSANLVGDLVKKYKGSKNA